jgi:hypothetical protein
VFRPVALLRRLVLPCRRSSAPAEDAGHDQSSLETSGTQPSGTHPGRWTTRPAGGRGLLLAGRAIHAHQRLQELPADHAV